MSTPRSVLKRKKRHTHNSTQVNFSSTINKGKILLLLHISIHMKLLIHGKMAKMFQKMTSTEKTKILLAIMHVTTRN